MQKLTLLIEHFYNYKPIVNYKSGETQEETVLHLKINFYVSNGFSLYLFIEANVYVSKENFEIGLTDLIKMKTENP